MSLWSLRLQTTTPLQKNWLNHLASYLPRPSGVWRRKHLRPRRLTIPPLLPPWSESAPTAASNFTRKVDFQRPCVFLSTRLFFFFNDTATTEIYTLSLHDALPISR